ncbi:MAG: flagellar export chaperone FliS [Phycisphaerae bacterium]|jgi:flagellar protein FliS
MSYAPDGSREYLKNAVMTANSEQLHLMLLDGAIRFTVQARDAIERQDHETTFTALDRAQRILLELSGGLVRDVNPELVDRMAALYAFIYRRLVDAAMNRDVVAVDEALRILRHQRETWAILTEKVRQQPSSFQPEPAPAPAATDDEPAGRFVAEG